MQVSPGEKIVIREINGNPAKNLISKKERNDLLILSKESDELLRVEDYFVTNNVDVVTWYNNEYVSYQSTDLQTGSVV